ncbi:f915f03b-3603-4ccf-9fb2-dd5b65dd2f7b [Sclerotinia trifoliorum]|uniref:F915f03b-3603-4ccf-9fb2-dd5b65dd2f7b n=1 Tax=Sclerotinia trifoliorum TaxID=28548 RepID=A0A8H2VYB8_9HELO|nr:f915f03b-3603-4ccf-9fb2-dd5b65dd2f7b [Sclerotinia trifoliorum]
MDQYVDFWNFMAYDYSGPWSTVSAHQANLSPSGNGSTPFNTQTGISYYIARDVGQGTWASGVYDYKVLPLAGATEVYDKKIGASYSWDTSKGEIISYDNPMVAIQKAEWIQSMNLGGAMWWETSADGRGSRSLIGSVMSVLGGHIQNVTNQLSFPNSTYANIRNGMPGFSKLPLFSITSPKTSTCYSTKAYTSSGLDIPSSLLDITTTSSPLEATTAVGSSQGTTTTSSSQGTTTVSDSSSVTNVQVLLLIAVIPLSVPVGFTRINNGKLPISTTRTTILPIPTEKTTTAITTTTMLSPKRRSGCNPNLECYTSSTRIVGPGYSPTGLVCATDTNNDPASENIRQFLPQSDHGSIIITTRSSQVKQGIRIHVQRLDVREGLEIVSNMSGRKGIEKDSDAIALVKELDGLPLALSTAGVYLENVTTSFSDYLQLYKTSWLKLQMTSPLLDSYVDRTLCTTWQITFDRIQQQNKASAKLLKLWAYFHRQDLWFDLLRHANSVDDEWIQKLTKDELNFNEAITLLCTFGLVDPDRSPQQQVGTRGYSVHSCVHSWIVFVLNKEWDKSLAHLALTCVASEVPDTNEKYWWLSQRRLLQHATRQAFFIEDAKVDIDGLYWGFHSLGNLYRDQGKLAEAEKMYHRALEGKEKALGPDHTSTLDTVNNLGNLYRDQGKLAEAEKMYHRALEGKEKALGPDHTSTLDTINNLGNLYSDQGKLAKAEKIYLRALEGNEKALGPDHTSTLDIINNLGNLYSDQGKLAEAEKMYLRALEGSEKALGPDHTSTLDIINNLGSLYSNQGKLAEAEKMYLRALEGYENALGLELASSYLPALNTMFNFGDLFSQTDRKDMARAMYNRALSGYTTVQGPSSKWSRQVEDRLQSLQVASAGSNVGRNEFTEPEVANSRSLKQKIRKLGRWLKIR